MLGYTASALLYEAVGQGKNCQPDDILLSDSADATIPADLEDSLVKARSKVHGRHACQGVPVNRARLG